MKVEQSTDYLGRPRYKAFTETGDSYNFINGRFFRNGFAKGTRCYKLIEGNWKYICFYFASQNLTMKDLVGQVDYEIRTAGDFSNFLNQ